MGQFQRYNDKNDGRERTSNSRYSRKNSLFKRGYFSESSGNHYKQGAQPGHQGYRRQLYPSEQVQNFHDLKPNECPSCKSQEFCEDIISTDVRQVIELPDLPPEVTQYNIHTCQCSCCGKHCQSKSASRSTVWIWSSPYGISDPAIRRI